MPVYWGKLSKCQWQDVQRCGRSRARREWSGWQAIYGDGSSIHIDWAYPAGAGTKRDTGGGHVEALTKLPPSFDSNVKS